MSPFSASIRVGGKFDSHVDTQTRLTGDSDGIIESGKDTASVVSLSAGWQSSISEDFGFRADYGAYADFHDDLDEYDVVDQLISIEPQWRHDSLIYSLSIRYNYARQDHDSDYHRFSAYPTLTFKMPNLNHALEVYGMLSKTNDVDEFVDYDEDSRSRGGGIGYVIFSGNRTYFRLLCDYRYTGYDERVGKYLSNESSESRHDWIFSINAEHNIQINRYMDIFINYTYMHASSNVSLYDYDRNVAEAGISLNF